MLIYIKITFKIIRGVYRYLAGHKHYPLTPFPLFSYEFTPRSHTMFVYVIE